MLIHGGPEGFWGHAWTYRWNAQVFAAAGYVVVMPNPRGSTGYGQKFIDEINGDWGGKAFDDIMAADRLCRHQPSVCRPGRTTARPAASYGGYMIDWILGHTQRFKALISHDGVYDQTERIRRNRGALVPALGNGRHAVGQARRLRASGRPALMPRTSTRPPSWSTASWISASPYSQALELFTALKLQKVPAKLLIFPDEGHWVLKPQNSQLWYSTVIDWLDSWVKK
jgi:dipeptidyl aminopeptidase/acylaminoacyl peptidase